MAISLTEDVLADEMAVDLARVLAAANKKARDIGVTIEESFVSLEQVANGPGVHWLVNYGPADCVNQRGGDVSIEVDLDSANIVDVRLGQ